MTARALIASTVLGSLTSLAAIPAAAQYYAGNTPAYEECERSDNNDQVFGAIAGGLLGGVIGNEIEKGEGTVIGGAAGAFAGAKIADKNCDRYNAPEYRQPVYGQSTYTQPQATYRTDAYGRTVITNPAQPQVAGRVETAPSYNNGMVLVTDPQTGQRFYVSQAEYNRYYR